MRRRKADEFPQELLDLFNEYVHGDIGRRAFLEGAGRFAAGGLTAAGLFEMLRPRYAWALQVPKDDARIRSETVTIASPQGNGSIRGYLVRPAAAKAPLPAVLVVHENRGLNPYIEDVARRLATADFIALAPDALTSLGGYPGDDEKGGQLFRQLDRSRMAEDFAAAALWLRTVPGGSGRIGVVGFCFGGSVANQLAVRLPELGAAVPFYGDAPAAADVPRIKAAVLVHHAELDTRLMQGWPAYRAALETSEVRHEGYVYPKANHGFHNDTTPRYDEAAASLAWRRTLAFLDRYLRA
jgi:carboxymethylenebutenolidase